MPRTRPPYPPAFRRRIVELIRIGRTREELSREFEPSAETILNRVRQTEVEEGRRSDGPTTEEPVVVLNAFGRRILGRAMATHRRTEPVLKARNLALWQRGPETVIHHSDQGCQYTSIAFGLRQRKAGVRKTWHTQPNGYHRPIVGVQDPAVGTASAIAMRPDSPRELPSLPEPKHHLASCFALHIEARSSSPASLSLQPIMLELMELTFSDARRCRGLHMITMPPVVVFLHRNLDSPSLQNVACLCQLGVLAVATTTITQREVGEEPIRGGERS